VPAAEGDRHGYRRAELVRLFLGCVVVASAWVWWVDANKKEPLVTERGGVTALVRSSEVPRGEILTGVLVVADNHCLSMDIRGAVRSVIWPFDSELTYDGQGISNARMLPRPAQNPPRIDARTLLVGDMFSATGTDLPTALARQSFPDTPSRCLTEGSVVVLDSVEGTVEPPAS